MKFREFKLRRDPECPVCGDHPTITAPIDYEFFCGTVSEDVDAIPEMSVQELKRRLDASEPLTLIDVREPYEYEVARIEGAKLIPLGELSERLEEIASTPDVIVHCHSGGRSAQAVQMLREAGRQNAFNLSGGIDAWSKEVDPEVARY